MCGHGVKEQGAGQGGDGAEQRQRPAGPRPPAQTIDPDTDPQVNGAHQIRQPEDAPQIARGEAGQLYHGEDLLPAVRKTCKHENALANAARTDDRSKVGSAVDRLRGGTHDALRIGNTGLGATPLAADDWLHDQGLFDEKAWERLPAPRNSKEWCSQKCHHSYGKRHQNEDAREAIQRRGIGRGIDRVCTGRNLARRPLSSCFLRLRR